MNTQPKKQNAFRRELYQRAIVDSFAKLNPRWMVRNPVMFVVEVGSVLTTALWIQGLLTGTSEAPTGFIGAIALWLWFTVLFANFSEAVAEDAARHRLSRFVRRVRIHLLNVYVARLRMCRRRYRKPKSFHRRHC